MHDFLQFCTDNQSLILAVLFAASEAIGANANVKANGFLSGILIFIKSLNRKKP